MFLMIMMVWCCGVWWLIRRFLRWCWSIYILGNDIVANDGEDDIEHVHVNRYKSEEEDGYIAGGGEDSDDIIGDESN